VLKDYCNKTLIRHCTPENALDFYGLACLYNLEEGKHDIQHFIAQLVMVLFSLVMKLCQVYYSKV
jgi:hypothetical protein